VPTATTIVEVFTVAVPFSVSHPIRPSVTAITTKGLALAARDPGDADAALRAGAAKAAAQMAAAETAAHVGSAAATSGKTTAVTASTPAKAPAVTAAAPAASSRETVSDGESGEKQGGRSRGHHLFARHLYAPYGARSAPVVLCSDPPRRGEQSNRILGA
jgi:hypothetical protein